MGSTLSGYIKIVLQDTRRFSEGVADSKKKKRKEKKERQLGDINKLMNKLRYE